MPRAGSRELSTSLDGISFIVLMHAPGSMDNGNIKVGLIVDEKANDDQVKAMGIMNLIWILRAA